MWSLVVVVVDVGVEHAPQVCFAEDEDAVEALGAHGADEPFGICVGLRCAPRRTQDLDLFSVEDVIEGGTEPFVAVVDQEPDRAVAVPRGRR